ncbi:RpiR family transcriptional regulator [Thalassobacillus devorans]|uniref:RpiR family transcriptional regulator n=1 Tax=Thalassobacillus devorans TaxID=279813 RepID=A0ABQ1PLQ1_9BACI|nr:MurR/RpiR family transcriptional regulator [Thalassobacillus devorans]NIK30217.1 DNA-binding MurR/RpiR family transcriptional regulator [Thalassobacillus devorans]GGC99289.1 RpiR family transcriptional regulator [Thalassobacillus devorans]
MDIQARAHKYEYKLNDTDDEIIEYIVKNKECVIKMSIQMLAKKFYTVPNTITRLSKKLGYDGFSQLKNTLKEEVQGEVREQDSTLQYNMKRTLDLVDREMLRKVADKLKDSRHIYIFGVGDTVPFCEILSTHIKIGGKSAEYFLHRHDAVYAMNHAKSQDVLILISMSGETRQIMEMAGLAKEKGVTIVSLTHFTRNSLESEADMRLFFYSPKKMLENYNISDKTPVMMIMQMLSNTFWETE